MAGIKYYRGNDLSFYIRKTSEGQISIQVGIGGFPDASATAPRSVVEASVNPPLLLLNALWGEVASPSMQADSRGLDEFEQRAADANLVSPDVVTRWRNGIMGFPPRFEPDDEWLTIHSTWEGRRYRWDQTRRSLRRVTLELEEPQWATWGWEDALRQRLDLPGWMPVVRISSTRPRAFSLPLTFPLRILDVTTSTSSRVRQAVDRVFGGWASDTVMPDTMRVAQCGPNHMLSTLRSEHWNQVDIIHFDAFPWQKSAGRLLSSATDAPGTLGWLMRLSNRFLPRLIVIDAPHVDQQTAACQLAAALLARGGPAVVVGDFTGSGQPGEYNEDLYRCYDMLIHDEPLDLMAATTDWLRRPIFFAGTGREDALRTSQIGETLHRWRQQTTDSQGNDDMLQFQELLGISEQALSADTLKSVSDTLREHSDSWSSLRFDHESEGMIPMARTVRRIRQEVGSSVQFESARRQTGDDERFLNTTLWWENPLRRLPPSLPKDRWDNWASLSVGSRYYLGVQIGPRDVDVQVIGAAPIVEKAFNWDPRIKGRWVEIGIVGLDFDVIGDPVQEVWLPRHGPSQLIYFAVVPRTEEVARLRICLFYRNDLIQSFCFATLIGWHGSSEVRRKKLARALDVPFELVGEVRYLARLEYSLTTEDARIEERGGRTISIIANHHDGEASITIKGADIFQPVRVNNNTKHWVQMIRTAMLEATLKDPKAVTWEYAFADNNSGDEADFKAALKKLAAAGWRLYSLSMEERVREELEKVLAGDSKTIHVAHILLEDVIPWAALYDRKYDERKMEENGVPVDFDVCLASINAFPGKMTQLRCGDHPLCPLHTQQIAQRMQSNNTTVTRETVVCPQHFWGYRHFIEAPIQQVLAPGSSGQAGAGRGAARELSSCVLAAQQVRLLMCYNAGLGLAEAHANELETLTSPLPVLWRPRQSHRDRILGAFNDTELDLIYMFCHAGGGKGDLAMPDPYLEFQETQNSVPGQILAEDLDVGQQYRWKHHPLVILNACETAGFSPDALPDFLYKLVEGRGAAGVLGTEVSVHEHLSTEVGRSFLERFLKGESVGQALREVRRQLLLKFNPLGLVYTLYASGDLKLDVNGDGKCE